MTDDKQAAIQILDMLAEGCRAMSRAVRVGDMSLGQVKGRLLEMTLIIAKLDGLKDE